MLLVNFVDRLPRLVRVCTVPAIAIIGLTFFDVMGQAAYSAFMRLSIITLCYLIVVAALASLRVRRVA